MRIALFADIHGKILLPFRLADLYQQQTGRRIDLILQCGDIGLFPHLEKLDRATIKHAKRDRDELGFHDQFVHPQQETGKFLERLNLRMICVRGNHEDHDWLDEKEKACGDDPAFPVDCYEKVWVCKSGRAQEFRSGEEVLKFIGIGRIGDRKGRDEKAFIQEYERLALKKLLRTKDSFDVLITHDKEPDDPGYGMPEIAQVLDRMIVQYHFYGHTGRPFTQRLHDNGITQCVKIKELEFSDSGILPPGCMVLLEKDRAGNMTIEAAPQQLTNQLTRHNWKFL